MILPIFEQIEIVGRWQFVLFVFDAAFLRDVAAAACEVLHMVSSKDMSKTCREDLPTLSLTLPM